MIKREVKSMNYIYKTSTLTIELAEKLVKKGIEEARKIGVRAAVSLVGSDGSLKAFLADDNVRLHAIEISMRKAYTSAIVGMPTSDYWNFISSEPPLLRVIPNVPSLMPLHGGRAIKIDGEVCGGIGVSGGHYSQDEQIAIAVLSLFDL